MLLGFSLNEESPRLFARTPLQMEERKGGGAREAKSLGLVARHKQRGGQQSSAERVSPWRWRRRRRRYSPHLLEHAEQNPARSITTAHTIPRPFPLRQSDLAIVSANAPVPRSARAPRTPCTTTRSLWENPGWNRPGYAAPDRALLPSLRKHHRRGDRRAFAAEAAPVGIPPAWQARPHGWAAWWRFRCGRRSELLGGLPNRRVDPR